MNFSLYSYTNWHAYYALLRSGSFINFSSLHYGPTVASHYYNWNSSACLKCTNSIWGPVVVLDATCPIYVWDRQIPCTILASGIKNNCLWIKGMWYGCELLCCYGMNISHSAVCGMDHCVLQKGKTFQLILVI